MPRTISANFRDSIEASSTDEVVVNFATITHPQLLVPITVNSDVVDYVLNGVTYLGCAFTLSLLTDDDQPPRAQVSIENVDERVGSTIRLLSDPPTMKLEIYIKSDFTDDNPRVAVGTPTVEYSASHLSLVNVKCDAGFLTGDIRSFDVASEPWPAIRTTKNKTPGQFR